MSRMLSDEFNPSETNKTVVVRMLETRQYIRAPELVDESRVALVDTAFHCCPLDVACKKLGLLTDES